MTMSGTGYVLGRPLEALSPDDIRHAAHAQLSMLRSLAIFDRQFVLANGTMRQRQRYHDLARTIKSEAFAARAEMAQSYLRDMADPATASFVVPREDGLSSIDLSDHPLVRATVSESQALYDGAVAEGRTFSSKGSLDFVAAASKEFTEKSALFALASSPLIVGPVAAYFGVFPILTGFGLTLARNDAFHRKSSQRLHFDPEDRSQLKVFVYVTDVDARSGPFMAAPASESKHLFDAPEFILDRQDDSIVAPGAIREFHGKAGTVIFCDTCRCLHAGAREGDRHRLMISIEYNMPSHLGAALYTDDPEPVRLRTRAIKAETSDPYLRALMGQTYI
jgi:hypothetical protein